MHDFDLGTWFGVLAPAGTPTNVLDKLNTEMVKVIKSPQFREKMTQIGAETIGNSRQEMIKQIDSDTKRIDKVIKETNITVNKTPYISKHRKRIQKRKRMTENIETG